MKHVNAVIVPSSRCAALPSLRRKDGGADIRVALLEAGFQEGDLVSIGMETIPPDEQLEQARAAAKANGEERNRLALETARQVEALEASQEAMALALGTMSNVLARFSHTNHAHMRALREEMDRMHKAHDAAVTVLMATPHAHVFVPPLVGESAS